jgi:chain length determinant protein EpsF
MSFFQYLRIIWARRWVVLLLAVLVAAGGTAYTLNLPKRYSADASLVFDVKPDPILGAMATPAYLATQVEIFRSDKVAARAVQMLGVDKSPTAVQQWREDTKAKIPLERYYAGLLQKGLTVDPARNSNVIDVSFVSADPAFAAAAANAFSRAYIDISIEMKVEPARQYAGWFEDQSKTLRANLEAAQARLSKFQQEKGITVSTERVSLEDARLDALNSQLAAAQSERVDAATRQRNSGSELSPDVQQSSAVQNLKGQLSTAESKLSEISSIVGANHPQRQQLEAQIGTLRQQLAAEMRRVSGGSSVINRASNQKVEELRAMAESQKRQVLALRAERDQISVLQRDVETAQRAYESVSQRMTQLTLESQTTQANVRVLSAAVEPLVPTSPKVVVAIVGSVLGGLIFGGVVALLLELLNRRVRAPEDLAVVDGVPVIGVLHPENSKRPVFRRLALDKPRSQQPLLPMGGTPR